MTRDHLPRVVACVITHNPGPELASHLAALRLQVDALVVIDNGSRNAGIVASAAQVNDCMYIGNPDNMGIAAALNEGVRQARALGGQWLAMFDQDSSAGPGLVPQLLRFGLAHPLVSRIGVLAASHRDRATQANYHHPWDILEETAEARLLRSTITSGSLVRLEVFDELGLFDESLFIDSVDHDFCLRARRHGWAIVESRELVLEHSIGAITVEKLFGLRVVCTHHNAQRRYYMTRNLLEVCRRFMWFDPLWSFKGVLVLIGGCLAVILYEDGKRAKLAAILEGAAHFACRRFGTRP